MSGFGVVGSLLAVGLWAAATLSLVREPGPVPGGIHSRKRRLVVLGICLAAGLGGCWGPRVHTSSEIAMGTRGGGSTAELVTREVRTPLVVASRSVELDARGERIREVRTRAHQVPVTMLAVLGWAGWWGLRRRRSTSAAAVVWAAVGALLLAGCAGDVGVPERGERVIREATWDTLALVESLPDDTVFFQVRRIAADAHGIRVLDGIGHRVALVGWDGEVRWYAGRRGSGPGELRNPRAVAVDGDGGTWILDVETHRITGFDRTGRLIDEVPLHGLEFVPHEFAVGAGGERFFMARPDGGVRPVEVGRDGRVRSGSRVRFPGSRDAPGLALQGDVRAEAGSDRWVMALSMGDGFVRFEGLDPVGGFVPWVEEVPLVTVEETVEGTPGSGTFSRTQRTVDPVFASQGAAVSGSRILVRFGGRTELRHRLLEVYDMDDGSYRGSLLLPTGGWIAAWGDRLVVGRNTPHPQLLVLRPSRWP